MSEKPKPQKDDKIFQSAKARIAKKLDDEALTVADIVALCSTLAKMKAVEIKAEEGEWGSGL